MAGRKNSRLGRINKRQYQEESSWNFEYCKRCSRKIIWSLLKCVQDLNEFQNKIFGRLIRNKAGKWGNGFKVLHLKKD